MLLRLGVLVAILACCTATYEDKTAQEDTSRELSKDNKGSLRFLSRDQLEANTLNERKQSTTNRLTSTDHVETAKSVFRDYGVSENQKEPEKLASRDHDLSENHIGPVPFLFKEQLQTNPLKRNQVAASRLSSSDHVKPGKSVFRDYGVTKAQKEPKKPDYGERKAFGLFESRKQVAKSRLTSPNHKEAGKSVFRDYGVSEDQKDPSGELIAKGQIASRSHDAANPTTSGDLKKTKSQWFSRNLVPGIFGIMSPRITDVGLDEFQVSLDGLSAECKRDVTFAMSDIATGIKMIDATAKLPSGMLELNWVQFGHFDQCVNIETLHFQGMHCMANVTLHLPEDVDLILYELYSRYPLFTGLCVPSTCTAKDVEGLVTAVLNTIDISVEVSVDYNNCRTKGFETPDTASWVVVAMFICFILVGVASTLYDVLQRFRYLNENPHPLWSAYSFFSNGKYLLGIRKDLVEQGVLTCLQGMRTVSTGWIILGHTYLHGVSISPLINRKHGEEIATDDGHAIVDNAFIAVDSFFLFSGVLISLSFFQSIHKTGTYDAIKQFIQKYIRLTAVYGAIIALEATVLNYVGNGPLWNSVHQYSKQNCQNNWWTNILYVNNFVEPLNLCLEQSWFLSANMQLFWISPLVLYPIYFMSTVAALSTLAILLIATAALDFGIIYGYELPVGYAAMLDPDRRTMEEYPFYTRMPCWVLGLAIGYLISGIRSKRINFELSPFWTTVCWIVSTILMTAPMQVITIFNRGDITTLEAAFFFPGTRIGWAIGVAWLIFACSTDIGGVVNEVLSWSFFQVLSKLSFGAFLLHTSVQRFRIGYLKTNTYLGDVESVWFFIADFVISYLLAIILFVLFERPFSNISRYLCNKFKILEFPKRKSQKTEELNDDELPHF